jgi:RNA polymerase sigma factor (sigma-70 family)
MDDIELLDRFARGHSEAAFARLVERHVSLVYSVALRCAGNPHAAEEITQAVFIILARKAKSLSSKTVLSGWLHQTARLTAANYLRGEIRRRHHEQEAYMQTLLTESANDEAWQQLAPHLDDAIARLRAKDRDALILRYFENKSLREVGVVLGLEERAAQKRVNRAVEKLRNYFSKHGIALTTTIIAGAVSANSVQAAPIGMAGAITATVAKGSTVAASTLTLVKGTMKMMTWLKMKFALGVGAVVLLASGAATVAISQTNNSSADKLTPEQIFKKARAAYALLSSYSDEGKSVSVLNGMTLTTTFKIKLARPDLYRVEWSQATDYFTNGGVAWSAGNGNFMKQKYSDGYTTKPGKYQSMQATLSAASGISAGATATIPTAFFKMNWGNQLDGAMKNVKQQSDNKVGDVDCYVFTSESKGRTKTLWIGKKDFLIHQVRDVISAKALQTTVNRAAKTTGIQQTVTTGLTSTETHEDISANRKFSPSDFKP